MFVLLALVFGVGFVVFGVGGGIPGTSLGDILSNNSGTSGPSVSELQDKIKKNPKDAEAYRDLATQLQQDGEIQQAIGTLKTLTKLQPKDAKALAQLGSLYLTQANQYTQRADRVQAEFAQLNPGAIVPALTTANGQPVLSNPLIDPGASELTNRYTTAVTNEQSAYSSAEAVYKRLAGLTPRDTQAQLQLAQVAESAGDGQTAIAAYRKVLALSPNDPNAPAIRERIKSLVQALQQQAAQASSSG